MDPDVSIVWIGMQHWNNPVCACISNVYWENTRHRNGVGYGDGVARHGAYCYAARGPSNMMTESFGPDIQVDNNVFRKSASICSYFV